MKKAYVIMKAIDDMDIIMDIYLDEDKRNERLDFYTEFGPRDGVYYKMDMELSD